MARPVRFWNAPPLGREPNGIHRGTRLVGLNLKQAVSPRALVLSLMLMLAASGCGSLAQPPGAGSQAATQTPPPVPAVLDTPTRVVPPTPSATATSTPLPTTPTPQSRLPLSIHAELDPAVPRAGEEFVVALSITNEGERDTRGIYVATTGPWDRWTVLGIDPSGTFAADATGWHIISPIHIPPHQTRTLEVHVRADEATEEQLTFAVRETEPSELP